MFQARLPASFWDDNILTSTYLINHILTTVLGYISPYETLFDKQQSYDHLRVFGCLAHMTIHDLDEFASCVIRTVFLGYSTTQKSINFLIHLLNNFTLLVMSF